MTPTEPILILSDLHLGHRASVLLDPAQIEPIVREAETTIFNGDTAEMRHALDRPIGRKLAAELAKTCHSSGSKAIFINGNHDPVISKLDHIDLADGKILVTHGDILFLGVAPWSGQAAAYRRIHQRALRHLGKDALTSFEQRLLATKRTAVRLQMMEEPVTRGRLVGLSHVLRQAWPPYRPFKILKAWWDTPGLAAGLARLYRPAGRFVIIGHTHFPGIWRRRQRIIINTGSYVLRFGARAVLIADGKLSIIRIKLANGKFQLGTTLQQYRL